MQICYRYQFTLLCAAALLCPPFLQAQQTSPPPPGTPAASQLESQAEPAATTPAIPQTDSSTITPNGTAHVTRVVPVPRTVSPEAQKWLAATVVDDPTPVPLAERRRGTDAWQARAGESFRVHYNVTVEDTTMAGVPVRLVTPPTIPADHRDRVLIDLHGGGFDSDSGSLTESVPVAALAGTKTIAVRYRLAPEHPFPAAVDDALAVYKEVLKTHRPGNVAIYGTSAGAILTGEVAARIKQLGLPEPGALGIFSGFGDWSQPGDSEALFSLQGLSGHLEIPHSRVQSQDPYAVNTPLTDPVLSPVFSDLHGMPPTLFMTSTRDLLLSGTVLLHRAFLRAGDDAQLVVFDALPHAFWNTESLPETREADELMAKFFTTHLGH